MEKIKSKARSFDGWNIWEFIKGRKKTMITVVISVCGYFALGQELTGLIAGPIFECLFGIAEYYFKKIKK